MSAREEILRRVRAAVGPQSTTRQELARAYRTHTDDDLATFLHRVEHYEAKASRVREAQLAEAVRGALAERGARRVVAPAGVPEDWLAGVEALRDTPPLDAHALDGSDGLVSTCAVAIAATGTIVLDGGEGMGRRALSLLPDYHLCVVDRETDRELATGGARATGPAPGPDFHLGAVGDRRHRARARRGRARTAHARADNRGAVTTLR